MKALASEWAKTKRTPMRWISFLIPVVFAAFVTWYFSLRSVTAGTQISIFQVFFEVWTAMVIPVGAGLISGLAIHQEELAGGFNGLLGSKLPRRDLYLGKLALLVAMASVSTLLGVSVVLVGLSVVLKAPVSWPVFAVPGLMAAIATVPLLAFHLWISFAWGMGASIGIGCGGSLVACLMATNLGNKIWQFIPWAWPVRLTGLTGACLMYLPGMNYPANVVSLDFIVDQTLKGLIPAGVFFAGSLIGGLIWFEGWEARQVYD